MYSVIIGVLSLFGGSTFCETADKQALMRDLIIILDETEATNPEKNWAAINTLHNALLAEAAPILINESAWQTFIKARQEWLLQSQIPGTSEYATATLRKQILERANYWYSLLAAECDDTHVRALMADKVNEEFYVKENYAKLQESGVIPKDMLSDTMSKTRHCVSLPVVFDAWYWFYLDTGYYLALPKSYCEKCTSSNSVAEVLVASGFKPNIAPSIVDPLAFEPIILTKPGVNDSIITTLQNLFLLNNENIWTIKFFGHGCHWKVMQGYVDEIVGISLQKFKEVCVLLDKLLSMRSLYVVSCHAGGVNRVQLTDLAINYPLIISCLSDNVTKGGPEYYDLLPNGRFACKGYDFKKNKQNGKWEFYYNSSKRFKRFFKKLHELPDINTVTDYIPVQQTVCDAFYQIYNASPQLIGSPHIFVPRTRSWLLCYFASDTTYLNVQSALLAEVCNTIQAIRTRYLLVEAPVFKMGWQLAGKAVESIVVMAPGDTVHYCASLQAPAYTMYELIRSFWPLCSLSCVKQILFDAITCQCDPKDPMTQMLGVTENKITFNNVLMRIVKNEQIELIFTVSNGDVFYETMRAIDGKPMFRNLQKLSSKAIESYRSYYDKTKAALIAKYDQSTATLRNHYLQAMEKAKVQAPALQEQSAPSSVLSAAA